MDGEANLMLESSEWAQKFIFLAQVENFKSRDLTEKEEIVKEWMEERINILRKKENGET